MRDILHHLSLHPPHHPYTTAFSCNSRPSIASGDAASMFSTQQRAMDDPNIPSSSIIEEQVYESLSEFELLPKELVWSVLEYAPEAVLDLRVTSRMLRSRVDEYVQLQATTSLITKLETYNHRVCEKFWQTLVDLLVYVPRRKSRLFKLRTAFRESPSKWTERFSSRAIWKSYFMITEAPDTTVFHTCFLPQCDEEAVQAYVRDCAGKRLGTVVLKETNDSTITPIYSLLQTFQFDKLDLETSTLSDSILTHIMKMIEEHKVEQVSLIVKEIAAIDPVKVLLDLSSLVRSLYIWQPAITSIHNRSHYFFGVHDQDWSPTIVEMFGGKLDKLFIDNPAYPGYLSNASANALIEKLPMIEKKIWFTTTIWHSHTANVDHQLNNNVINITQVSSRRLLSVKHVSRFDEPFRGTQFDPRIQSLFARFRGISLMQQ